MSGRGTIISARALFAGVALLALAACDRTLREGVDTGIESGKARAAAQAARLDAAQRGQVIVEKTPYYGRQVEVKRGSRQGKPLPKKLEGANGIDIAIDGKVDIRTIAGAIEAATDIPVSVRTRYIVDDAVIEVPIGSRMTARHKGALSAFLDRVAARMDVAWHYDGRSISIDRMVRREWRIPLPRGTTTISDTIDGEGINISTERQLDPWAELEKRLAPLAPPPGRVVIAQEAGRVSVFGPPSVQRSVGRVLDDVVTTASKRIALEVGVFFVDSDQSDAFGVSLNNLINALGTVAGNAVTGGATSVLSRALSLDKAVGQAVQSAAGNQAARSAAGSRGIQLEGGQALQLAGGGQVILPTAGGAVVLAGNTSGDGASNGSNNSGNSNRSNNSNSAANSRGVSAQNTPNSSIGLEALARNSAVVDYRLGSTTVQSGVIAPISLTRTESYNRRAPTTTNESGSTTGGIETEEFETGIIIAALPRLIDRNRLQLSLNIVQSDLVNRDAGGFPVIDKRTIRSEAVLDAGEMLVVSGYEQQRSEREAAGLAPGLFRRAGIGGRNAARSRRVRMYVLIRPAILARRRR